jgi:ABC-type transport system involved in multi-copper enzyme maturation permease subunit
MPIFDQGYQHWRGTLSGHAWRWLAIARHGVRVQMKNRLLRLLLLLAWLPALTLIAAVAVWGLVEQRSEGALALVRTFLPADILLDPRAYRGALWTIAYSFFFKMQMFCIMLLVVVAGPGLISRDLRFNALPLYFSRPLTRLDYLLGKLGVIGALVAAVAVGPAVFAYVIGVCFSLDVGVVRDTYPVLLASVAYGLTVTLSVGSLMLALSSLTRRSLYVGIAWAGIWIISGSVGSIMTEVHRESARRGLYEDELARGSGRIPRRRAPGGAGPSRSWTSGRDRPGRSWPASRPTARRRPRNGSTPGPGNRSRYASGRRGRRRRCCAGTGGRSAPTSRTSSGWPTISSTPGLPGSRSARRWPCPRR